MPTRKYEKLTSLITLHPSKNDLSFYLNVFTQNYLLVALSDLVNWSYLTFDCYLEPAKQLQVVVSLPPI